MERRNYRRNCCQVILQMIQRIPKNKKDIIADLEANFEDAKYKAPEESLQWDRTAQTLMEHIGDPEEEWEYKVLSIFMVKSVDEIKKEFGPRDTSLGRGSSR